MNCKQYLLLLLLLMPGLFVNAQTALDSFAAILPGADSVILISHAIGYTSPDKNLQYWITEGKIEPQTVKERHKLDNTLFTTLKDILLAKDDQEGITGACFSPHQAILIYRSGTLSYMDICFHCSNHVISFSQKIANEMSYIAWERLRQFFWSQDIRFAMEERG